MKELELVQLYCYLCECYNTELWCYCQRFTPNTSPINQKITDEELLTIYFYCRRYENKHTKVQIYDYADRYLRSWFPQLPAYANFNTRLNFLENAFLSLIPMVLKDIEHQNMIKGIIQNVSLIDSLPIVLCKGKRQGKVAKEISDKTYCASKNMYYCGVKLHVVANQVEKKLPFPNFISMTKASENDLTAIRPILPQLANHAIFADKAYCDKPLNEQLLKEQNTYIYTPVKLIKGQSLQTRQFNKADDDLFSKAISSVRQPIEGFFNWMIEKSNIQNASKVRATKGLFVHVWGSLATTLMFYLF